MAHSLLDGLAGLTGPLLRDRLIAARAAAIAAAAGDKASPVYMAMLAQQDRVVAAMREAVEAIVASLPAEAPAAPEPEVASPAQAPIRRAPPPPMKTPPAKAAPATSRLAGLRRATVEDAEPPEPGEAVRKAVWTPPPPVTPQCRPAKVTDVLAKRPPPPPLDPADREIPW
ncbi:hypothetical protein ASF36_22670 [Methylobacterium sp. Leaf90]|nr:hypothetical protein ASF36_22670 [Methylobacterium sp. Leaf90]